MTYSAPVNEVIDSTELFVEHRMRMKSSVVNASPAHARQSRPNKLTALHAALAIEKMRSGSVE